MCGILGIFSREGVVEEGPLRRGVGALVHRGPDAQRTWRDEGGRVGFGHTRLSIIDLQTGDQPLVNETGDVVAVVNGEFYDHERIREGLVARGHAFRSRTDSEILLHLYEEKGTYCFDELRGEFAFILWDRRNGRLFAGRDRFGIKPLYYAWHQNTLHLASEVKALFAAGVPARWDREALFQTCQVYLEPDRSLFHGVFQLRPGHFLLATRYDFQLKRYWDMGFEAAEPQGQRSDEEWIDRTRAALDEAVRLRLRADVPVGVYLSGGIDSCSVLGVAARHRSEPFETFTVCFKGEGFEEEAVAAQMARHVGARFHPLHVTDDELADHFGDAVFHSEILPANENGVAKFLLSRLVRDQGVKVVLTGEGGDEVFAGYAHFRRDLLLAAAAKRPDDPKVRADLEALEKSNAVSRGTLFPVGQTLSMEGVRGALGFVPSWLEAFSALGARLRTFFGPDALDEFGQRDPYRLFLDRFDQDQLRGRDGLQQAQYVWTKTYLTNYVLIWLGDRAEMAHSIEGREPLLDHHLMEAVRGMPPELKIRSGVEKYALREAAKPFVVPEVYARQKHPFTAPPALTRPDSRLYQLIQDTLRGKALDELPLFHAETVRSFLDRLPEVPVAERHVWSFPLMRVVGACVLQERFRLGA